MRTLLDTCVVSELSRRKGSKGVRDHVGSIQSDHIFLSVLTIGELTKGIALLGPGRKRNVLSRWLLDLEQDYGDRILPIDAETAHIWGDLTAAAQTRGRTISASDGLIAATAIRHGLRVLTRNVSDFEETGAMLLNPWDD